MTRRALIVAAVLASACGADPCDEVAKAQTCVATLSGICTPGIQNQCMEGPGIVVDGWCIPDPHPEYRIPRRAPTDGVDTLEAE